MACLESIGVIELVGLATAIECADVAVKAADVKLLGYELSKGGGMVTIKIRGNVGAVQAAVAAGTAAGAKVGKVVSKIIIPRPHQDLDQIILSRETVPAVQVAEDHKGNGSGESVPESDCEILAAGADSEEIIVSEENALSEDDFAELIEPEPVEEELRETKKATTCNICSDPECPRQKGEPHANCIHFKDEKK
ncbi:MAG: BMC domain-containing protein [Dehalobacterium sp.]